jgi:uncharacterized membrane protein YhiD involved in acid resistance
MENIIELFSGTESIDIIALGTDLVLSAVVSALIYLVFVKYGSTISSRRQFGRVFVLVAVCTTLIIAIIKSSIALSLGLVGALSIVRFRAAVKEPEELAYLFLCVAVGLGFGAGLRVITLFAATLILLIIAARGEIFRKPTNATYNFSVNAVKLSLDEVVNILRPYTNALSVRRIDSAKDALNLMFTVEFKSLGKLESAVEQLKSLDESVAVSFISNETIL